MNWLNALPRNRRRGSFPRCLLMMSGDRYTVAGRLQTLVSIPGLSISEEDIWMPRGIPVIGPEGAWDTGLTAEAKLGESDGFLRDDQRKAVTKWWLEVRRGANTPNWDIASTCTIENRPGLLLIEAKAHDEELNKEIVGKKLRRRASEDSKANHKKIAGAILSARNCLQEATLLDWQISRDSHYQMSNRFAWSWKLTELGFPVALVYLGFLKAEEMKDKGKAFVDHAEWELVVKSHSKSLFPPAVWNRQWTLHKQPFIPLIRSIERPLRLVSQEPIL